MWSMSLDVEIFGGFSFRKLCGCEYRMRCEHIDFLDDIYYLCTWSLSQFSSLSTCSSKFSTRSSSVTLKQKENFMVCCPVRFRFPYNKRDVLSFVDVIYIAFWKGRVRERKVQAV
jgi:hypothetical protein